MRQTARTHPNELWVTDITHRTREGWVYCATVLDAYSRRIVSWSIDSKQDATLLTNALDITIRNRHPAPGGIVHVDQIELLNGKKWETRVELANAIFEYIEIFDNRQRRHFALGCRTPIKYETLNANIPAASWRPEPSQVLCRFYVGSGSRVRAA